MQGMNGSLRKVRVTGPLGDKVDAAYGIIEEAKMAVIEMSAAAGITLVPDEKKNPLFTTTYGVGEMIRDAIEKGCRKFVVGIGGSATNDGGIGMLQALGYDFLNSKGNAVPYGAKGLEDLAEIRKEHVLPELAQCEFKVACDVTNPLWTTGSQRCVRTAKRGDAGNGPEMDQWLADYAKLAANCSERADAEHPGTRAAGGLGFAFLTFTNAVLESGIKIVLEETKLEQYIQDADIVITGEGRLDGQTAMGKAPVVLQNWQENTRFRCLLLQGA